MIVYLAQDIPAFVMYCIYGESRLSLPIDYRLYDILVVHYSSGGPPKTCNEQNAVAAQCENVNGSLRIKGHNRKCA